jgi:hypothetical protein
MPEKFNSFAISFLSCGLFFAHVKATKQKSRVIFFSILIFVELKNNVASPSLSIHLKLYNKTNDLIYDKTILPAEYVALQKTILFNQITIPYPGFRKISLTFDNANSTTEITNFDIYSDETINDEFYAKRMKLKDLLHTNGYQTNGYKFENIEYDEKFDMYLYEEIGYPILTTLTMGLFCSPYGATSVREYFANAFEHYFIKSPQYVKKLSPAAYKKVALLTTANYFDKITY